MSADLEALSESFKDKLRWICNACLPCVRRFLRFLALPYCFSKVNWRECTKSRTQVAFDFIYIFFRFKYFPDNYSSCRLWEKSRADWVYYYGSNYDPYQRRQLRKIVQPESYEIVFKDKVLSEMLCKANYIETPEILRVVREGENLEGVAKDLAGKGFEHLIFKPRSGKGGGGIVCTEFMNGSLRGIVKGYDVSIEDLTANTDLIVQKYISQHKDMSRVSKSTNTIRAVTIFKRDGEVLIIGTYARFGVGNSKVDNLSQGGICVSVDADTGELAKSGFNRLSQIFEVHPTTGVTFEYYRIPLWNEVIEMAKKVQKSFCFYPLLGMDIAITAEGPVVIEINSSYDNVDLEQATGPILKKPDVYQAFNDYDLLINKYQRNINKGC